MNLPNKLTIARIGLTAVFLFFLFGHGVLYKMLALLTFALAALTDLLDGYIAKKYNMVSDFGRLMDPIADKILTLSAFLAFIQMHLVPAWMVMVIILRELTVTGIRFLALQKKNVIEASVAGKHKTVSQVVTIFVILIFIVLRETGRALQFWTCEAEGYYEAAILVLMSAAVLLTIVSGVSFFIRNKNIFINHEK